MFLGLSFTLLFYRGYFCNIYKLMTTYSAASLFKTRSRIAQIVPNDCWDQILSLTNVFTNNSEKLADLLLGITKSDILQGQALFRRVKENVDLLTSCQCLTICKKLVSKELLLFLKLRLFILKQKHTDRKEGEIRQTDRQKG